MTVLIDGKRQIEDQDKPAIVWLSQFGVFAGLTSNILYVENAILSEIFGISEDKLIYSILGILLLVALGLLNWYNFRLFSKREIGAKYVYILTSLINVVMVAALCSWTYPRDNELFHIKISGGFYGLTTLWLLMSSKAYRYLMYNSWIKKAEVDEELDFGEPEENGRKAIIKFVVPFVVIALALIVGYYVNMEHRYRHYCYMADKLSHDGDFEESTKYKEKAIDLFPERLVSLKYNGDLLYDRKQFGEAQEQYLKALEFEPNNVYLNMQLAYCYHYNQDLDSALKYYLRTLELKPDDYYANYNAGAVYNLKKRYQKVLDYITIAEKLKPGRFEHYYYLGSGNYLLQRYVNAIKYFSEVFAVYHKGLRNGSFSKRKEVLFNLSLMGKTISYLNMEDFQRVLDDVEYAVNEKIDTEVTYSLKEEALARMGKRKEADSALQQLKTKYPDSTLALRSEAHLLALRGNDSAALESYNKAVSLKPDDPKSYWGRCRHYMRTKQYKRAREDAEKALTLRQNDGTSYALLAGINEKEGKYSEALADVEKAISLSGPKDYYYLRKAGLQFDMNKVKESLDTVMTLIKMSDKNPAAYTFAAEINMLLGKKVQAISLLDKAVYISPTEVYNSVYRAGCLFNLMGMKRRSKALAARNLNANSVNLNPWRINLLKYMAEQVSYEEALKTAEETVPGEFPTRSTRLGRLYFIKGSEFVASGNLDEAEAYFTKCQELKRENSMEYVMIDRWRNREKIKEASNLEKE